MKRSLTEDFTDFVWTEQFLLTLCKHQYYVVHLRIIPYTGDIKIEIIYIFIYILYNILNTKNGNSYYIYVDVCVYVWYDV